jgi:hypothetical protein
MADERAVQWPVPYFIIVLPGWSFSRATSAATSPVISEAFHVVSCRLAEATNLGSLRGGMVERPRQTC